MGQNIARAVAPAGAAWFTRGFLALAALWLVAQAHVGGFLGAWRDAASLPGNICWLLIAWCLSRLIVDWAMQGLRARHQCRDGLFLLACLLVVEVLWRALGGLELGLAAFFGQPVMVILGFAALHRRRVAG